MTGVKGRQESERRLQVQAPGERFCISCSTCIFFFVNQQVRCPIFSSLDAIKYRKRMFIIKYLFYSELIMCLSHTCIYFKLIPRTFTSCCWQSHTYRRNHHLKRVPGKLSLIFSLSNISQKIAASCF